MDEIKYIPDFEISFDSLDICTNYFYEEFGKLFLTDIKKKRKLHKFLFRQFKKNLDIYFVQVQKFSDLANCTKYYYTEFDKIKILGEKITKGERKYLLKKMWMLLINNILKIKNKNLKDVKASMKNIKNMQKRMKFEKFKNFFVNLFKKQKNKTEISITSSADETLIENVDIKQIEDKKN